MTRTHLIALCVSATLLLRGTSYAATLYQYNFDNGTSGTWTPSDASWTICRTVTTGTPEYCQTDATAAAARTSFDGDPAWGDYSVEADVKLYDYPSAEIGIIGHAQDASHYYRLSLRRDPTTGPRWWSLSRIDGGVVTVLASGVQYFQIGHYIRLKLTFYKQHIQASASLDQGLTFNSLGFVDDTRYRTGKIGLTTSNTTGTFDNVAVNTLATAANTRRFGHIVIMTLENQNYTSIIGNPNMPYLNSLLDQGALLTNFYANFHPSQPNYFALTTAQSFYTKEGPIPTGTSHVVNALATKNKTWKGYYADVTTHEAVFRYFPEIWQNPAQLAKIVPIFPNFMRDVTTGSLPSYSIIHDLPQINGHDCTDGGLCMGPVDDRLRDTIAPYLKDPSFVANNDLLIVMFDEAQLTDATCSGPTTIAMSEAARVRGAWKCGGRAVALFLGASVKRGYQSTALYHYEAFLRLSLEGLGVTDALPGASAFAPNMNELFEKFTPADTTPPTIVAAPLGGSFASAQSVTLTATDNYPGTSIYFTTNGSTPTSASTRYTAPISIATTTTLKFVAIDAAGNSSAIGAQTYAIASVPQGGALPARWQTQDIGAVGVSGNASFASGTYSLTGAGADIWGTADALRYAYTTLNGDGQVTARVATEQNVNVWTKAGVMIRDSVAPGSAQAVMLVSPGKGNAFQRRVATNGVSTHTAGALATAPYWVRLTRVGHTITASQSADGTTWTVVGTDTIAFAQTVLIGLAVSSHSTTVAATATFDNVVIKSAWSNRDIGAVGLAGSTSITGAVFTLKGAGADIWGTADAFHFTYQRLTGDGEIVARVATVSATNAWHKVGVMIRNDLTPGSAHGLMLVSSGKGLAFQRRVAANGVSTNTPGPLLAAPRWVKIARAGNVITAFYSNDGKTWNVVGSDTIVMGPTIYIGLANSSHSTTALGIATVDAVKR